MRIQVVGMCVVSVVACGFLFGGTRAGRAEPVQDEIKAAAGDWPWWRGPQRSGEAESGQSPPLEWSDKRNVLWKTPVPGRGHSSPIVVGKQIFLTTADEKSGAQFVLCYEADTGKELWKTQAHASGGMRKNAKSSAASSTCACDGGSVYVTFANSDAVYLSRLDLDGRLVWQKRFGDYQIHQGYASSPALYRSLVLVSADHKGGGVVAGVERKTGEVVWQSERPKNPNYASPILLRIGGRDQLILTGCDLVTSYEPLSGKKLWETAGSTTECVTSTVTDGERVFSSGGYPRNHLAAVLADGSGKLSWENNSRVYVPSLVIRQGYLYGVMDAGIAACWKSDTGQEMWKSRLRGTFSSSAVLVGDRVYATSEEGETYVFRTSSDKYEQLAVNRLGNEVFATPTFCRNRIYTRVTEQLNGARQEMLYCLGEK